MSDDNDFIGSSFSNYDTTENRMSDSGIGGRGSSGEARALSKQAKIQCLFGKS